MGPLLRTLTILSVTCSISGSKIFMQMVIVIDRESRLRSSYGVTLKEENYSKLSQEFHLKFKLETSVQVVLEASKNIPQFK